MRKLMIGLGILVVLLIAAIAILPQLIPSSVYKDKIQTELSRELNRDVRISGDVKLAVFPTVKARTGRVEIANPEGFSTDNFASMDGLDAKVKFWPLLSKRVEIKAFTLNNPSINLEKNAAGEPNWLLGADKPEDAIEDAPSGPFKRDGRYAAVDPAIGLFAINEGAITYIDKTSAADYRLTDVNVAFSLPSMSKPVKIDGDFAFNGDPIDLSVMIDTPRGFLDGENSPVTLVFNAPFAKIDAKGAFLEGQDITFDLNVDGAVDDVAALIKRLPMEVPYSDLADSAVLKGDYIYDGKTLSAKNATISAKGELFDADFAGGGAMTSPPSLDGNMTLSVKNIPALAAKFGQDIKGLELVRTANISAALASQGKGFAANNIDASLGGNGINANFKGTGAFADAMTVDGAFTANAASIPDIIKALNIDMAPAAALGEASIAGQLSMVGETIKADITSVKTQSPYLSADFVGQVTKIGEAISATGNFNAGADKVADLLDITGIDMPPAKSIGKVAASGVLDYSGDQTQITSLKVKTEDGVVTGNFDGNVTLKDVMSVNGAFDTSISSLAEFRTATGMAVPYARSIGKIGASGKVTGQDKTFNIADLKASLSDGDINGNFSGSATTANGFALDGRLDADIPSLRKIAAEGGTELPPSTDIGPIFESFSIAGDVAGTPSDITFKNADLQMDGIKGKGDFSVDLKQSQPFVNGTINTEGLDLRPYMASYAAQNPTGKIQPWGENPINPAPLKAVDGDFKLTAPFINTGRMNLGQSDINAKLRSGILVADFPNMSLYGGLGSMTGTIDATGSVPAVSMEAKLNNLESDSFLGAVAGFTQASGNAGTGIKFSGRGASVADIMKSLDGGGDFKLVDGAIAGLDLGQFMGGLDAALTSRQLPSGIGSTYATKFKDIIGLFTIEDGVAKIGKFSLDGAGVMAEGQGQIDLGNQAIDFSLRPRLTGENASDLASFGIPIRFTGDFGGVRPSLDTDLLTRIVAEKAKAAAKDELQGIITDNVGGTAGEILGGILGGQKPVEMTPPEGTEGEAGTETTPPAETAPEDPVGSIIGGIFGNKPAEEPQPAETPPAETPPAETPPADEPPAETPPADEPAETEPEKAPEKTEEQKKQDAIENTLGNIFGKKKDE